ncbi:MAG: class I SAM-dependent methyltransferase, partial [Nanoarchaeota archaeon]
WEVREKVGVDPSRGLLAVARRNYPRIRFEQAAAEKLPFGNHSFDVVISLTAIQNFEDVPTALGEIARVGKDQFVLSFLKNSPRKRRIQEEILKIWPEAQMHTQQKDMIVTVGF